jgi:hypothetical protein
MHGLIHDSVHGTEHELHIGMTHSILFLARSMCGNKIELVNPEEHVGINMIRLSIPLWDNSHWTRTVYDENRIPRDSLDQFTVYLLPQYTVTQVVRQMRSET